MRKHKETFKTVLFILIAVVGLGYFGFSFYRENVVKENIKTQQIVKSKDLKKPSEKISITTNKVKEWGDLFFYFVEKGIALTATGVGIYLTIKQKTTKKKT
jgi:hypothetical protein